MPTYSDSHKSLTLRLPTDEYQALVLLAHQDQRSLNSYVRRLIRADLALQTAEPAYAERNPS